MSNDKTLQQQLSTSELPDWQPSSLEMPPPTPPPPPQQALPKPNYLPARSLEYIFFVCTSIVLNLVGYVYFYRWGKVLRPLLQGDFYYDSTGTLRISREEGKKRMAAGVEPAPIQGFPRSPARTYIAPPLFPFSLLGSVGVDVADPQWSTFFATLPLIIPMLFLFVWVGSLVRRRCAAGGTMTEEPLYGSGLTQTAMESPSSGGGLEEVGHASAPPASSPLRGGFGGGSTQLNHRGRAPQKLPHIVHLASSSSLLDSRSPSEVQDQQQQPYESNYGDYGVARPPETFMESLYARLEQAAVLRSALWHRPSGQKAAGRWWKGRFPALHPLRVVSPRPMFGYHALVGLLMVCVVSGPKVLFEVALVLFNYFFISKLDLRLNRRIPFFVAMLIMWIFMVSTLFLNHYYKGYVFRQIFGTHFFFLIPTERLDGYKPLMKWTVHYNMAILRMIAFNNDAWEARRKPRSQSTASASRGTKDVTAAEQQQQQQQQQASGASPMAVSYALEGVAANRPAEGAVLFMSASVLERSSSFPAAQRCREVYAKHAKVCVECALLREAYPALRQAMEAEEEAAAGAALGTQVYSSPVREVTSTPAASSPYPSGTAPAGAKSDAGPPNPPMLGEERHRSLFHTREILSCYKCRSECPRRPGEYNLMGYLGFLFYPPLFFSGPMMSYNAYVSMVTKPSKTFDRKKKVLYGFRVLYNLIFMVAFMHYFFVPALLFATVDRKDAAAFGLLPPPSASDRVVGADMAVRLPRTITVLELFSIEEKCYLFYAALAFLWCKFNVIWKLFRFFAIMDGIEPPEDMPHCFSNTVSITDFWQCWHASFNLWIVRYMYIPMGGNRKKLLTLVPIFLFIAIWHDIELRLLQWALFMCVCFVPEIAIITFFTKSRLKFMVYCRSRPVLWRRIKETGATIGEWALILANLIGFSTGGSTTMNTVGSAFEHGISKWFVALFLLFYIGTGKLSVRYREVQAYQLMCTRQRLDISLYIYIYIFHYLYNEKINKKRDGLLPSLVKGAKRRKDTVKGIIRMIMVLLALHSSLCRYSFFFPLISFTVLFHRFRCVSRQPRVEVSTSKDSRASSFIIYLFFLSLSLSLPPLLLVVVWFVQERTSPPLAECVRNDGGAVLVCICVLLLGVVPKRNVFLFSTLFFFSFVLKIRKKLKIKSSNKRVPIRRPRSSTLGITRTIFFSFCAHFTGGKKSYEECKRLCTADNQEQHNNNYQFTSEQFNPETPPFPLFSLFTEQKGRKKKEEESRIHIHRKTSSFIYMAACTASATTSPPSTTNHHSRLPSASPFARAGSPNSAEGADGEPRHGNAPVAPPTAVLLSTPQMLPPRGFRLHHIADWVLCILLAAADVVMVKCWSPHCRTFQWDDASINYPMHANTFPTYSLALMAVAAGVLFILWYLFLFRWLRQCLPGYGHWCPYQVPWAVTEPLRELEDPDETLVVVSSPPAPTSPAVAGGASPGTSRRRPASAAAPSVVGPRNFRSAPAPSPPPASYAVYRSYACNTTPVYTWLTALIWSVVMTLFTTEVLKNYAGRLRPDYLARLRMFGYTRETILPDGKPVPDPRQDPQFYCELGHSVSHVLLEGRLSFPSGHSSISMCVSTILTLFLMAHLRPFAFRGSFFRLVLSLSPMWLGLLCSVSRTRDNWHNFSDILAGAIIGVACALLGYALCFRQAPGPGAIVLERADDDVQERREAMVVQRYAGGGRLHACTTSAPPPRTNEGGVGGTGSPPLTCSPSLSDGSSNFVWVLQPTPCATTGTGREGASAAVGYGATSTIPSSTTAAAATTTIEFETGGDRSAPSPPLPGSLIRYAQTGESGPSAALLPCLVVTQRDYNESSQAVPWLEQNREVEGELYNTGQPEPDLHLSGWRAGSISKQFLFAKTIKAFWV
eukprot:gene12368-8494_t